MPSSTCAKADDPSGLGARGPAGLGHPELQLNRAASKRAVMRGWRVVSAAIRHHRQKSAERHVTCGAAGSRAQAEGLGGESRRLVNIVGPTGARLTISWLQRLLRGIFRH